MVTDSPYRNDAEREPSLFFAAMPAKHLPRHACQECPQIAAVRVEGGRVVD
jgi:hypothetical protein